MSAEEIRHRSFPTAFRGFDQAEVRQFLDRLAREVEDVQRREEELQRQLREARDRILNPKLDEETLTSALGQEAGRILHSAHEAAADIRRKAEESTARILSEAHEQADATRSAADAILAERTVEAEAAAEAIRSAAAAEAGALSTMAHQQAEAALAEARARSDALGQEAETARTGVLGELTRRRRVLHAQVEQLGAGREAVLRVMEDVRRLIDEITDSLDRVGTEAKTAADEALRRGLAQAPPDPLSELPPPPPDPLRALAPPLAATPLSGTPLTAERPTADRPTADPPTADPPGRDLADDGPEVRVVGNRPLRLLRPEPEPAVDPEQGAEPDSGEEPELVVPGLAAETEQPAAVPLPAEAEPGHDHQAVRPSVDELFARLRAEREAATEQAQAVLAAARVTPVEAPSSPEESVPLIPAEDAVAEVQAGEAEPPAANGAVPTDPGDPASEAPAPDGGEAAVLERRNDLLVPVQERLARKLKRTLQDDQNDLLDRVRNRPPGRRDPVLPDEEDHRRRYAGAVTAFIDESCAAGMSFAAAVDPNGASGPSAPPEPVDPGPLAAGLADDLVAQLRGRLAPALDQSGSDEIAVAEAVNGVYRSWKGERIESLAMDHAVAAFGAGLLAAVPQGTLLRWVVDDDGGPCPDCDDNGLAGPTPAGEEFPTGQRHPPAHPGCRCLLVPTVP